MILHLTVLSLINEGNRKTRSDSQGLGKEISPWSFLGRYLKTCTDPVIKESKLITCPRKGAGLPLHSEEPCSEIR